MCRIGVGFVTEFIFSAAELFSATIGTGSSDDDNTGSAGGATPAAEAVALFATVDPRGCFIIGDSASEGVLVMLGIGLSR